MSKAQLAVVERAAPIALADMTAPHLTEAHVMLDQMAEHHDGVNTVCCLLDGIVLIELKRRLGHGHWKPWLKENYPKSNDSAERRMRAAADFLNQLQTPKNRSTAVFGLQAGVDLLRQDLATTLRQLEHAKLDLAHPLVRAASLYAKGRSFYQLCLDLGPQGQGGHNYDHSEKGKGISGPTAQPPEKQATDILWPAWKSFFDLWRRGLWVGAPRSMMVEIDDALVDMRDQIKKARAS